MLKKGQVLNNRYQIHEVLGEGGFGTVYKVWDDTLQRFCAIKENLQASLESQKQFKREAIMLANLNHPHLVRVTDYLIIPDQGQYLVMDYVEGDDLQTILTDNEGPLPSEQALAWIRQVCDALIYIHNQNPPIIHRDIKPANIRITPQGNAVLVDFGLAKNFGDGVKTLMGARGLTPHFAAPEQYGTGGTDAKSDIYSLGVTLYCLLTYCVPPDSVEIMLGNAQPPPPVKMISHNISDSISDAIQRAMQIRRTERYKSVSDLKKALGASQSSPPQNKASSIPAEKPRKQSGADLHALDANHWYMKGKQLCDLENYEEAIHCFENALQLEPQYAYAWHEKAFCEENLDRTFDAIHSYEQVLEFGDEERELIQSAVARLAELERDQNPSVNHVENIGSQNPRTDRKIADQPADVTYTNKFTLSNGMEFMRVPAGKFLMGSDNGEDDEKPQHTVNIPYDYWMARYPITNEQYNLYIKAKRIAHPVYGWEEKKDNPVIFGTWNDVMDYCKWLNTLLKTELPSGLILRLPTEAEWEKAARGTDGREYPWGNSFDKNKCNSEEGGKDGTTSVGLYSPQGDSPYGCADMAGNVWDWTHSEYKADPYNVKDGREDEQKSVIRVLRGGAFKDSGRNVRCAFRHYNDPMIRFFNLGFRVVVSQAISKAIELADKSLPIEIKSPSVDPNNALNYYNLGVLLHEQNRMEEAEEAYRKALYLSLGASQAVQVVSPAYKTPAQVDTSANKFILSNGMEFMRVPAGKFLMGRDNYAGGLFKYERPQHTVDILYDYWMARFPVTNEQYNTYVKAKIIKHPVDGWESEKDHPVDGLNWHNVMDYCKWLNSLLNAELPSGLVFRLPTEAEWEKAARGTNGYAYPWGNEFDKNKFNTHEGGKKGTTSVGLYSPQGDSPYGCVDMSGNVWEWTHSLMKKYPYTVNDGREDEKGASDRVLRGGSFSFHSIYAGCAFRSGDFPGNMSWSGGFRVVVSHAISTVIELADKSLHIEIKTPRLPRQNQSNALSTSAQVKATRVTPSSNKLTLSNGMEFIRVTAGKFLMGRDNDNVGDGYYDDDCPQHTIDIPYDYWMARFPVTNKLYNTYAKANGFKHPVGEWKEKKGHPVTQVSWDDAMAYCKWLNDLLKSELSSSLALRLPTEAEWEKAARGTDGRKYPWGNGLDQNKCNSMEGGKDGTTSVGLYSPLGDSPFGCADMAGNVWEWTHSEHKAYPYNVQDGREDEQKRVVGVLRGGSYTDAWRVRCSFRYKVNPNYKWHNIGFRVVVSHEISKVIELAENLFP